MKVKPDYGEREVRGGRQGVFLSKLTLEFERGGNSTVRKTLKFNNNSAHLVCKFLVPLDRDHVGHACIREGLAGGLGVARRHERHLRGEAFSLVKNTQISTLNNKSPLVEIC